MEFKYRSCCLQSKLDPSFSYGSKWKSILKIDWYTYRQSLVSPCKKGEYNCYLLLTTNQYLYVLFFQLSLELSTKRANQLNLCSSILVIQSKYRKEGWKRTFFPTAKATEWILDFWWWTTAFAICRIAYIVCTVLQ